jgi:mercuric ion binding protein
METTMKLKMTALALFAAAAISGVGNAAERTVTLKVENMTCDLCAPTVRKSLSKLNGVIRVQVSPQQETATVTFDDTKTDLNALTSATKSVGYPSRVAQ